MQFNIRMEVYGPKDLMQLLKVSRATVHHMLHSGELPAVIVRAGKKKKLYRVYADAFDRWRKEKESAAVTERESEQV
jgi:excisionase family DNA binding protein